MKSLEKLEEEMNEAIAKRKKAQAREKKAKEAYQKALNQTPVGLFEIETKGIKDVLDVIKSYKITDRRKSGESNE